MGHLLIHLEEMAENAGRLDAEAKECRREAGLCKDDSPRASARLKEHAWHLESERDRLKRRCAEIREEGLQRYFAQQAVRVTDLRSGDHDRHEIKEVSE